MKQIKWSVLVALAVCIGCTEQEPKPKGGEGINIEFPGGSVKVGQDGVDVKAPNVDVKVDQGAKVDVQAPGVDFKLERNASESQ